MRANMYMDENAKMEDPVLYKPLKEICDKVGVVLSIQYSKSRYSDTRAVGGCRS